MRAYSLIISGYSLNGLIWYGSMAWLPTYFMRIFGWTTAEVGYRYGLAIMVAGTLGSIAGGVIASNLHNRGNKDANILVSLASLGLSIPTGILCTVAGTAWLAYVGVSAFVFACAIPWGAAAASIQDITPNQLRGQVSAVYLFALNFIGLGIGPTLIAFFTDSVYRTDAAVGQSIATAIVLVAPFSAILLQLARRAYRETLAKVQF